MQNGDLFWLLSEKKEDLERKKRMVSTVGAFSLLTLLRGLNRQGSAYFNERETKTQGKKHLHSTYYMQGTLCA